MTTMLLMLAGFALIIGGMAVLVRAVAPRRRPWSDGTTRGLAWAACAWTLLAGIGLLLVPMTTTTTGTASVCAEPGPPAASCPPGVATTGVEITTSSETLLEAEGAGLVPLLLVPVAVTLVGAPGDGPAARRRRLVTGWVMVAACLVGAMSLGIFYAPAALALLTAGLKTPDHPPSTEHGRAIG